ncbi:sulfate permease [Microbacterium lacticum]
MLQLLIAFVSRIYAFFQRTMPTNILIRATHTRRGLKWGVPAMLLAVLYIVIAAALAQWVAGGAPGWINLVVLVCLCYAVVVVMPMMLGRSRSAAVGGLRLSA